MHIPLSVFFGGTIRRQAQTAMTEESVHARSVALMRFLSDTAKSLGVGEHVYVVGGAVRNWVIGEPIKDVDVMIDAISAKHDSEWFAKQLQKAIPVETSLKTNQYGVAILSVVGDWKLDGYPMAGETIEIANARQESYGEVGGKGYKPSEVKAATVQQDVYRREFTFNTLMWRMSDLAQGPDKAEIVDLTGCGLRDLKAGVMRCPSDPDQTFSDDPTRMVRAIKFMVKYNFKIEGEVEAAIKRNAAKIRNVPQNAIAKLLIEAVLNNPKTAKKALLEMKRLGLLLVISDMIREDPQFRTTMQNWVNDQRLSMLFDMLDLGLPLSDRVGFLSPDQQKRFRTVAMGLPEGEPERFLAALKQPGTAWNDRIFLPALSAERGIEKSRMKDFAQQVMAAARQILLDKPFLVDRPADFKQAIRTAVV